MENIYLVGNNSVFISKDPEEIFTRNIKDAKTFRNREDAEFVKTLCVSSHGTLPFELKIIQTSKEH